MAGLVASLAMPALRRPARPAPARRRRRLRRSPKVAPEMTCPTPLGIGVKTKQTFCDVMTGRDPAAGILIKLPPHRGPVTLTVRPAQPAHLLRRAGQGEARVRALHGHHRRADDGQHADQPGGGAERIPHRGGSRSTAIGGGAGPGGVKAVAPTGAESISIAIPGGRRPGEHSGRKADRSSGADGNATLHVSPAGRLPIISNVMIEYRPGASRRGTGPAQTGELDAVPSRLKPKGLKEKAGGCPPALDLQLPRL